jgi:hypothetical protein
LFCFESLSFGFVLSFEVVVAEAVLRAVADSGDEDEEEEDDDDELGRFGGDTIFGNSEGTLHTKNNEFFVTFIMSKIGGVFGE